MAVRSLRRALTDGGYAPHKPLLLLWALGRLQRGEPRLVADRDAETPLADLLAEFGPAAPTSPHYPFWHAVSDGVWTLQRQEEIPPSRARPTLTAMRAHAVGGRRKRSILYCVRTHRWSAPPPPRNSSRSCRPVRARRSSTPAD